MPTIRTMAVYCGSNTGQGDAYLRAASDLGSALAARDIRLVYGGTNKGLMGALADAVLAGGGHVTGVITERLKAKGHNHHHLKAGRQIQRILQAQATVTLHPEPHLSPELKGSLAEVEAQMVAIRHLRQRRQQRVKFHNDR